jgi:hypothetical protein
MTFRKIVITFYPSANPSAHCGRHTNVTASFKLFIITEGVSEILSLFQMFQKSSNKNSLFNEQNCIIEHCGYVQK